MKVTEVVDAATRRLVVGGYEELSVASIGRELGLSPNSIYWYFPSKDDLFIAGVREILATILAAKPPRRRSLTSRVLWFVEELDAVDHVRRALYERARKSPVVAEFVEELDAGSRQMLANALSGSVPDADLSVASEALLATVDGASLRNLSRAERRRVISFTLERFRR